MLLIMVLLSAKISKLIVSNEKMKSFFLLTF